ncbi:hypothetical protein Bpfe_001929 [Biomphalaria pfeifferi]|uniref:Uncharacterized protein n=1 Tax=Biomphalaria pfeifferi TaxID=112525 RepID=A0AAD8C9N4_BIOPF|nr:hypothetical protein Bpfe_001929 [Biomphalaria pfeifferi]
MRPAIQALLHSMDISLPCVQQYKICYIQWTSHCHASSSTSSATFNGHLIAMRPGPTIQPLLHSMDISLPCVMVQQYNLCYIQWTSHCHASRSNNTTSAAAK